MPRPPAPVQPRGRGPAALVSPAAGRKPVRAGRHGGEAAGGRGPAAPGSRRRPPGRADEPRGGPAPLRRLPGAEASYLRVIGLVEAFGAAHRAADWRVPRRVWPRPTMRAGVTTCSEHFDRAVMLSRRSEGLSTRRNCRCCRSTRIRSPKSGVSTMHVRFSATRCGWSSASTARPACAMRRSSSLGALVCTDRARTTRLALRCAGPSTLSRPPAA